MPEAPKVIVVEDNDFVRLQIVSHLKGAGYDTLEAVNGDVAMNEIVGGGGMDLAIVDVRMEPVGGFEFMRLLKGAGVDMPVILVTGDDTPDLLEQAGKHGASALLMKPVDRERLLMTVKKTIDHRKRKA